MRPDCPTDRQVSALADAIVRRLNWQEWRLRQAEQHRLSGVRRGRRRPADMPVSTDKHPEASE